MSPPRKPSPAELLWTALPPALRRRVVRALYDYISRKDVAESLPFLNFGYAPATVDYEGELHRPCAQLYEEVARLAPLEGLDVLEVSSGRGGGAAWVKKKHGPASLTGLDLSARAVAYCRRTHRAPGLSFVVGDAEALPFDSERFDAVLNVEAALNYPSVEGFVREVARVLRPGGHLLFTDVCLAPPVDALRARLTSSGLVVVYERDITANVVAALDERTDGVTALIERSAPRILRKPLGEFAANRGTPVYERFRTRENEYWLFSLRKPAHS